MVTTVPATRRQTETNTKTAFLIVDTESIPDGRLLNLTKYPDLKLSDAEAIEKAREEAREASNTGSDFIPVPYQIPVAVCVARVASDYTLTKITCLDAPQYRSAEMVRQFWLGVEQFDAKLVTFNGRGFDMPMLELAAFKHGFGGHQYFQRSRNRFSGSIDLLDWFTNFGAYRLYGGLNLLAKMIGLPGKMDVAGDQVYQMHQEGRFQEINDYCMCDTLDTYFVFLRTRVMTGDLTSEREATLVAKAHEFLTERAIEMPVLKQYLDNWAPKDPV
ncbi:MAG: ribonuclease H-like domain-containing protein [Planctomycetes bacterium]|nr:ribonuclease H-like domain-containing protein [Planctomycetota bacterium]